MKVALVHDWLIHMRGGEKVLESLAELFPDATIYTLFSNRNQLSPSLKQMKIKNSFLHYLPKIQRFYMWLLPILPFVIRTLQIKTADLVISSSHCVAKGVKIPSGAVHICYCHTPMRYLWGFEGVYFENFPRWFLKIMEPVFSGLRNWDRQNSEHVQYFICNSENVRVRIKKIYGRDAIVIYPPVNTDFFKPAGSTNRIYYLVVSALTPYKRVDIVIEAFNRWDRQILIAGDGPNLEEWRNKAESQNIRFLGKVTDEKLRDLYSNAKALIFPQEEDFGIVPLEAQACGTPVIAFARGGALETVKDGVFFHKQTPQALREAIEKFESMTFDSQKLREQILQFDKKLFKHKIRQTIQNVVH